MPQPLRGNASLTTVLDADAPWDPPARTERLLSLCSPLHRARLDGLSARGVSWTGAAYRRVRVEEGQRVQRTELRFDGLAGCLRTPAGGSSRQFVVNIEGSAVRSRKLTAREGARLMGLPDEYRLPLGETAAWRVIGDGVCVPVVRWLAETLLEPLCAAPRAAAA